MAGYPTPSAYQEAVQFPDTAFVDSTLQDATPRTNVLGLPQPISGAFAVVFPLTDKHNQRWAAKCFLTDVPDQQARYQAIAAHLDTHDLSALVTFDYQQPGIRVEGDSFPLLKMEWVEGTSLNEWVRAHTNDPEALQHLAEAWAALLQDLHAADIAHGDLQHGNIRVADTENGPALRLVDYDTMYVPALSGKQSPEVGHRNYQHPDRTEADFGMHLDHFAGLVIYTGLQAVAHRPALWDRFDTGENLLFRDSDFYDPEGSPVFGALRDEEALSGLVRSLEAACYRTPEQVPPLADVLNDEAPHPLASDRSAARQRRQRREQAAPRSQIAQWWAPATGGALLLALVGGYAASWWLGAAVALITLGAALGVATYAYRKHPITRRRQRLRHESDRYTALIDTMERELNTLSNQKQEVKSSVEERRAKRLQEVQDEALYDCLKHHFIGEVGAVDGVQHSDMIQLKANNIRTAYEATSEAIAPLRRITDATKARIQMWRSSLVQSYGSEIPDQLSPAEERRLQRYITRRMERLDTEAARVREKIRVYEAERRRTQARMQELPSLSAGRYAAHLLYLAHLPRTETAPRPTAHASPSTEDPPTNPAPVEEGPWWHHS